MSNEQNGEKERPLNYDDEWSVTMLYPCMIQDRLDVTMSVSESKNAIGLVSQLLGQDVIE